MLTSGYWASRSGLTPLRTGHRPKFASTPAPFRAVYSAFFLSGDFSRFLDGLRGVWQTLAGEARFEPLEEQLVLHVTTNGRGGIHVAGEAWQIMPNNSLRFALTLDQTFLERTVRELEETVSRMAAGTDPTR